MMENMKITRIQKWKLLLQKTQAAHSSAKFRLRSGRSENGYEGPDTNESSFILKCFTKMESVLSCALVFAGLKVVLPGT